MLNRFARHVAGEHTVTKLAQTSRRAFDRNRAKECTYDNLRDP